MKIFFTLFLTLLSSSAIASSAGGESLTPLNLTDTVYAWLALAFFVAAYFLVIIEDQKIGVSQNRSWWPPALFGFWLLLPTNPRIRAKR